MKCDDFKFEYTVAPNEIGVEASEHLASCGQCQLFAEQESVFEQQLKGVINNEVPDGLRHSLREHVYKVRFWNIPKASLALAASLLVAVGVVTINPTQNQLSTLPVDQLVYEHFSHDGMSSTQASHQLNEQELIKVSKEFGVRVTLAENISFAEKCPIGDSYGLHMVYQYQQQPVTVIYMPEITLDKTIPFHYAGLHGWVKPLKNGSIAVLGGSTIDIPDEEFADKAIEWL
ncbi:MAG: hypothetical protein AXW16_01340 [Cycloclasticus sp. Phe_18]|nr:MAG: hypothetical protein AXW16_01340 [Cycloclasticus sp. Phe_18]